MRIIFVVVAALWLSLVAYAQFHCPLLFAESGVHCSEGAGPIWFLVMVTSPIGGFAVLGLFIMVIAHLFRR